MFFDMILSERWLVSMAKHGILMELDHDSMEKILKEKELLCQTKLISEMESLGFHKKSCSFFLCEETMDVVKIVVNTQKLSKKLPWLLPCLKSMRIYRITDDNDLLPALKDVNDFLPVGITAGRRCYDGKAI